MIALRPARAEDAAAIAAIYAPHVLAGIASFETEAPDAAAIARRMAAAGGRYPWLVATADPAAGDVLAFAYASASSDRPAYRWTVETTIYVADAAQHRGAGRQLYAALLATLRAQGFTQAIARIALPNNASIALHEALGFHPAGVLRAVGWKGGRWIDVGQWQCEVAQPATPPGEARPFADVG